jgi:predicted HTH transcriptional regulator
MTCEELTELRENYQFEAKSAQGQNGNGEIPKDLWESYSAMANTEGGKILLGAKELKDGSLEFLGIKDIDKVQKEFWTTINNPQKVNRNILNEIDLQVINCKEKSLILLNIPRVSRIIKPIYIGQNPLMGTYLRYHDSDIKANEDIVKHFLADAVNESNDTSIMEGFTMEDVDTGSLKAYRNIYKSTKLNHPWIELDDKEFLIQLGGYKKNRKNNLEGLTLAGLLMFGKFRSILDGIPNYLVDYQEQTETPEDRWIDRITTDGTWSGNLFEFGQKVYRKLTSELKVPFKLKDSFQRIDESNIHEAIREALVNTLIHANYNGRIGIQIVKHPKGFSFRNPGLLRVSKEDAFKGGHSDCRNKTLQKMFQYIGMGEQAGSGFPKMLRAWMEQHWQYPYLEENTQLETTTLFMPTISLFPKEIQDSLEELFGNLYINLDKNERLALILAFVESEVSNIRLSDIGAIHPADTSKILRKLVDKQLLNSEGIGRGTKYYINQDFDNTVGKPVETVETPVEQEIAILDYLKEHNKITTSEVKQLLDLKASRSGEILRKMVDKKLIIKLGSGKNTYYEVNK